MVSKTSRPKRAVRASDTASKKPIRRSQRTRTGKKTSYKSQDPMNKPSPRESWQPDKPTTCEPPDNTVEPSTYIRTNSATSNTTPYHYADETTDSFPTLWVVNSFDELWEILDQKNHTDLVENEVPNRRESATNDGGSGARHSNEIVDGDGLTDSSHEDIHLSYYPYSLSSMDLLGFNGRVEGSAAGQMIEGWSQADEDVRTWIVVLFRDVMRPWVGDVWFAIEMVDDYKEEEEEEEQ